MSVQRSVIIVPEAHSCEYADIVTHPTSEKARQHGAATDRDDSVPEIFFLL